MNARQWTAIGMGVSAAILGVVELKALANKRPGDTISEIVGDAAKAQPLTLVAAGATVAHFANGIPAAHRLCVRHPLLPLGMGLVVGALCWPLRGIK